MEKKRSVYVKYGITSLVIILVFIFVGFAPSVVQAKTTNLGEIKQGFIGQEDYEWFYEFNLKKYVTGTKVKNLKSSNKKVAEVIHTSKNSKGAVTIKYNGLGKAVLKWDVYKGKKYITTMKVKVVLVKCTNPFTSFKIGKKNYAKEFSKTDQPNVSIFKKIKGKVNIKVKKGWKIKEIKFSGSNKDTWSGGKKIKNKSTVTCKYVHNEVMVEVYNEKTKKIELYALFMNKY